MKINLNAACAVLTLVLNGSMSNAMHESSEQRNPDISSTQTSVAGAWRAAIDDELAAYERAVLGVSFKDVDRWRISVPCACADFDELLPHVETPIIAQLKQWGYAVPQLCMDSDTNESVRLETIMHPSILRTRVLVNKHYYTWPVLQQSAAVAHEMEHQNNNHGVKKVVMGMVSDNDCDIMHRYMVAQEKQADIYACIAMGSQGCEALRLSLLYALKNALELGIVKNNNKTRYSKFGHSLARIVGALHKNSGMPLHRASKNKTVPLKDVEQLVDRDPRFKEEQLSHPSMYARNKYLKNLTAALKKQELGQNYCDNQQ